jgi:hypothetical protein
MFSSSLVFLNQSWYIENFCFNKPNSKKNYKITVYKFVEFIFTTSATRFVKINSTNLYTITLLLLLQTNWQKSSDYSCRSIFLFDRIFYFFFVWTSLFFQPMQTCKWSLIDDINWKDVLFGLKNEKPVIFDDCVCVIIFALLRLVCSKYLFSKINRFHIVQYYREKLILK